MPRHFTLQKTLILAVLIGAVGIGSAAAGPVRPAHASFISVVAHLVNNSDRTLVRSGGGLSHGCWVTQPPAQVAPGANVTWESDSCGILTGTEGEVFYQIQGEASGQNAHFYWDDPTCCSNSFASDVPANLPYVATNNGPAHGDNITVNYTFGCSSTTCDGIPDAWKQNGVWIDSTDNHICGVGANPPQPLPCKFIDLPNMGATVNKPDIFLQIDWMADANHSHQISQAALQRVVTAFANSPYKAVNGAVGINLHIDEGVNSVNFPAGFRLARALPHTTNLGSGTINSYDWSTACTGNTCFDTIKNAPGGFQSTGRAPIFHYVVSAHDIAGLGNSGISRGIPGSDLIVSLGSFCNGAVCGKPLLPGQEGGTVQNQAGTLMHELGHNLGLGHGGGDGVNNKPNYFSIMNYDWQLNGLVVGGVQGAIDYSRSAQPNLNEGALSEPNGLGASAANFGTQHWCPAAPGVTAGFVTVNNANGPIDWNCNGKTDPSTVSFDASNGGSITTLNGFNDWGNLLLRGGNIGVGGIVAQPTTTEMDMLDPQMASMILPLDTTPPTTTEAESATQPRNAAGWYRADVTVTLSATDDISGVALTQFNLDGAGWTNYSGPVLVSAEGVHTFQYRSTDRSQNVETAKSAMIRIDKTVPTVALTGFTPNGQNGWFTSKSAAGGVQASDNLSGLASIACTDDLNGLSPASISPGGVLSVTQALTITNDGVHHIACTATDVAANAASTPTLTVKVDSTPPVCTAAATPNSLWPPNSKLVAVSVGLTASDAGSGLQKVSGVQASSNEDLDQIAQNVLGLNVSQIYTPQPPDSTGPASFSGSAAGQVRSEREGNGSGRTYMLTYTATDMAGNSSSCAATVVIAHDQAQ